MPPVVTDKGNDSNTSGLPVSIPVTLAAGASIIAFTMTQAFPLPPSVAATWNSIPLNNDVVAIFTGENWLVISSLHGTAGGTANLVVSGGGINLALLVTAAQVTGLAAAPLDQTASGGGTGTSASSGATAPTTQADELLLGVVGTALTDLPVGGVWGGGFAAFQDADDGGNVVSISTGTRIVAATGSYTASKTGISNSPGISSWLAAIATYKASAGGVVSGGFLLRGVSPS